MLYEELHLYKMESQVWLFDLYLPVSLLSKWARILKTGICRIGDNCGERVKESE